MLGTDKKPRITEMIKKKNSADVLLMHLLNKRYSPKTHSDLNHSGENKNKTHSSLSLYFFIF
jgi:hypothetical protein